MLLLINLGLVSPEFLRKQRRIAYFIIFVFAELITPVADTIVDPVVVIIPMGILFEFALFTARFKVLKSAQALPASAISSFPVRKLRPECSRDSFSIQPIVLLFLFRS